MKTKINENQPVLKMKGFRLSQEVINKLDVLSQDYRNNSTVCIEALINKAYEALITKK